MSNKIAQIQFCLGKIKEILDYLRPANNWKIIYTKPEEVEMSDWKREYLKLLEGEDYFIAYYEEEPMYAINVTGDSVLCSMSELTKLLVQKF